MHDTNMCKSLSDCVPICWAVRAAPFWQATTAANADAAAASAEVAAAKDPALELAPVQFPVLAMSAELTACALARAEAAAPDAAAPFPATVCRCNQVLS